MPINIGEGAAKLNFKNVQTVKESCGSLTVPVELTPFFEPSFLLPGESRLDFEAIRQMMVDDIRPETNIEWLWTLDVVELSWEVLRYRRLKSIAPVRTALRDLVEDEDIGV